MRAKILVSVGLVLTSLLAGCDDDDETDASNSAGTSYGGTSSATGGSAATSAGSGGIAGTAAAPLSDAEILEVVIAANESEIAQAEVAQMHAQSHDVVEFAEMMISDHTTGKTQAETLGVDQGIEPASSQTSETLRTQSETIVSELGAASSEPDFDVTYMQSQVVAHELVLDIVETELIPQADDAMLQALLSDMKIQVQAHLETAQNIVTDLM